jgi:hypothetical protein
MKFFAIVAATALVATAVSGASVQAVPESTIEVRGFNHPGPSVVKIDPEVKKRSEWSYTGPSTGFTPNRDMADII